MAYAGDRLVLVRPHVDDDPVDPAATLRTWWRHYGPFARAVAGAGVSVSVHVVRSGARPGDPAVDELVASWKADGAAVEAVRDIWFSRQELRRLESGHRPVVSAYGGADKVAARHRVIADRLAERRAELAPGVADAEVWQAEGLPSWSDLREAPVGRPTVPGDVGSIPLRSTTGPRLHRHHTPLWTAACRGPPRGFRCLRARFVAQSAWRSWFERLRPAGRGATRSLRGPLSRERPGAGASSSARCTTPTAARDPRPQVAGDAGQGPLHGDDHLRGGRDRQDQRVHEAVRPAASQLARARRGAPRRRPLPGGQGRLLRGRQGDARGVRPRRRLHGAQPREAGLRVEPARRAVAGLVQPGTRSRRFSTSSTAGRRSPSGSRPTAISRAGSSSSSGSSSRPGSRSATSTATPSTSRPSATTSTP